jgi:hypothetical protein
MIQTAQVSRAADHDLWLAEALKEIQTIQPGKTHREDLVKLFRRSGGLSTSISATFIYKDSSYIKVDIEFTPAVSGSRMDDPKDIVKSVSKPYLDWPVFD